MPADSMFVSVCVIAMFAVFAAVLYWGDRQTSRKQLAPQPDARRRPF